MDLGKCLCHILLKEMVKGNSGEGSVGERKKLIYSKIPK